MKCKMRIFALVLCISMLGGSWFWEKGEVSAAGDDALPYTESFDGTELPDAWGNNSAARIEDGEFVLKGQGIGSYLNGIDAAAEWRNYSYKADVTLTDTIDRNDVDGGVATICAAVNGDKKGYELALWYKKAAGTYHVRLYDRINAKSLKEVPYDFSMGQAYELKMEVSGNNIKCYVAGELLIDYNVPNVTELSGTIGINALGHECRFDNLEVSELTPVSDDVTYMNVREDNRLKLYGLRMEADSEVFSRMDLDVASEIAGSTEFSKTSVYTHAREAAGGRIRFSTDSPYIAIKAVLPSYVSDYATSMGAGKTGFDVYVDTEAGSTYYGTISPSALPQEDKEWSYEGKVEFDTEETRNITIYFPITNEVSEVYVGVKDTASVGENAIAYEEADPIVFYGSSITQGGCVTKPGNTYVNTVGRMLGRDYLNLGVWGSAKGETKFAEYIAGLDMSIFVFDYDHNSDAAGLRNTHENFYKIVREAHPEIPIILISRPNKAQADWEECRAVIKQTYDNAVANGDENVYFIDGQSFFGGEQEYLADNVHPNDQGHALMAEKVGALLAEIIENNADEDNSGGEEQGGNTPSEDNPGMDDTGENNPEESDPDKDNSSDGNLQEDNPDKDNPNGNPAKNDSNMVSESGTNDTPKTGDDLIGIWVSALMLCLSGTILVIGKSYSCRRK